MKVTIAEPSEADALNEIAFAAKRHWGYPEHWIEQWRSVLTVSPEFISTHETLAALEEQRILGFAALGEECGVLWLLHLWVSPAAMGRGVGRALFRETQRRAQALGFFTFDIESDPHAAGFYERMGAECVRIHATSIGGQPRALPIYRCHVLDEVDRDT